MLALIVAFSVDGHRIAAHQLNYFQDSRAYLFELARHQAQPDPGALQNAIHFYRVYERFAPDDVTSLVSLGYAYSYAGDQRRAWDSLREACRRWPDNIGLVYDQVMIAWRWRRPDLTKQSLDRFFAMVGSHSGEMVFPGIVTLDPDGVLVNGGYNASVLSGRLAAAQAYAAGDPLPEGAEKAGDLFYFFRMVTQ